MADTAVGLLTLTETNGAFLSGSIATGGTAVSTGDTAVIAAVGNTRDLIITLYGTAASTANVLAGDEPPSELAGLGNSGALTIGNGLSYVLRLKAGQFVQSDGTVRILVGGTGPVEVSAYVDPSSA